MMAYFDLTSNGATSIPDSPAAKRQKTAGGYGYNSAEDSGDELFEGITTPAKHFTQPTQIIDTSALPFGSNNAKEEILVPASSPFGAHNMKNSSPPVPAAPEGRFASSMAPAGTLFKAPIGIQKVPVKPKIIDLDENDGPTYQGGSSGDEIQESAADIKPSVFKARSKISFGSSGGSNPSFQDLMSTFRPTSTTAQFERNGSTPATTSVNGIKHNHQTQSRPERALPIGVDITLEDITDPVMRRKVERVRGICPQGTKISQIMDTLVKCKGSVDDATNMVLDRPEVVELSDDDKTKGVAKPKAQEMAAQEPQMRRQLKQPLASIQERYSSTQHHKKVPLVPTTTTITTPPKPKRRLMQGRRNPDPASPASTDISPPKKKVPEKVQEVEVEEIVLSDAGDYDSDMASESEEDPELDGRVLSFLNKCTKSDLVDLANIKDDVAEFFLSQRPFKNLDIAREVSNAKETKTGKKSAKAPIGDKIVQTSTNMMSGYEAVDALVATCSELGKPLTEEMTKWGFDVFGAAKGGELEMVSLDDDLHDSAIGTPSSKTTSDAGDDEVKTASRKNRVKFLKKPEMMSDDLVLKDYQLVGLNWLALLYQYKLSCILADDMGLGKSI